MVSDCLHHIHEALICFEKRKFIVGLNVLRKPLLDSLIYLSWILCREEEFYNTFTNNEPEHFTQKKLGNHRLKIFEESIELLNLKNVICANELKDILYLKSNEQGLYMLFQHAVHLITDRYEIKTQPQNFNFIFKSPASDDIYDTLYDNLPYVLLYLSQVIQSLFDKMQKMDEGSENAFQIRSIAGYYIVNHDFNTENFQNLYKVLSKISCEFCNSPIKLTQYNLGKIVLTDSYKCTACRKNNLFPFSWLF